MIKFLVFYYERTYILYHIDSNKYKKKHIFTRKKVEHIGVKINGKEKKIRNLDVEYDILQAKFNRSICYFFC